MGDLPALRRRSEHAVRNTWIGKRILLTLRAKIVDVGFTPSAQGRLGELCARWCEPQQQVGSLPAQSWHSICELATTTCVTQGMALVVCTWHEPREMRRRRLCVPWSLQVVSPEWLDSDREDGGIECDESGWTVRYHLRDPDDYAGRRYSIDAERVSVVMHREWPGQRFGEPWLAPILLKIQDLAAFDDAELMRAKLASMFVAFVHASGIATPDSRASGPELRLEPGRIQELSIGEEVTFSTPPAMPATSQYIEIGVRACAVALGLTYEDVSGDYSKVNYSSGRMGALLGNKVIDTLRLELFVAGLCADVERWLLEAADLMGILGPEEGADIVWTLPGHPMIDPQRDIAASRDAIASGLSSIEQEIRRRGGDPDEVAAARARDRAREPRNETEEGQNG